MSRVSRTTLLTRSLSHNQQSSVLRATHSQCLTRLKTEKLFYSICCNTHFLTPSIFWNPILSFVSLQRLDIVGKSKYNRERTAFSQSHHIHEHSSAFSSTLLLTPERNISERIQHSPPPLPKLSPVSSTPKARTISQNAGISSRTATHPTLQC